MALVLLAFAATQAKATWKPEYSNSNPAVMAWFSNAKLTPAAQQRLQQLLCCEQAERVKLHFVQGRSDDEWFFWNEGQSKYVQIPPDIIHLEGIHDPDPKVDKELLQLRIEGVLMVYHGQLFCFWPPEPQT
jgi:hypothetical protein